MTSAQDGEGRAPRHAAADPDESTVDTPPSPETGKPEPIKRTRISGTWIAVVVALIVGVFLLVFILQNLDTATVRFLGMTGSLPLAVAMLLSAVAGALLVALIGAARILQLRKETRKARKAVR